VLGECLSQVSKHISMQLHVCGSIVMKDFRLSSFWRFLPSMCLFLYQRKILPIHSSSNFTAQVTTMGVL
jgi:hypothetical protein